MFASCFTVNHRGKPGPLLWLVQIISCPFFYFATLPGDKQVLSLVLFVSGMLPSPQLCIPPPLLQRYFVSKGAWSGANPNRDLPVYPLSALTLAGVAFLQGASIWAPQSLKTDRQGPNCWAGLLCLLMPGVERHVSMGTNRLNFHWNGDTKLVKCHVRNKIVERHSLLGHL